MLLFADDTLLAITTPRPEELKMEVVLKKKSTDMILMVPCK